MRKSLGDKRREIPVERAEDILKILADFKDGDTRTVTKDGKEEPAVVSRIYPTTHFGFRKITVERPLRLNFQASPERIARLEMDSSFPLRRGRRFCRRSQTGTRLLRFVATKTVLRNRTPICATPKASRFPPARTPRTARACPRAPASSSTER
jgi:hypothetical protein